MKNESHTRGNSTSEIKVILGEMDFWAVHIWRAGDLGTLGSVSDFRVESPADHIADQARQALSTFDLNGDGRLDAEELRFMLCSVGEKNKKLSEDKFQKILTSLDMDQSGFLTVSELTKYFVETQALRMVKMKLKERELKDRDSTS